MNDPRSADIQAAVEAFRRFLRTRDLPVTGQREQVAEVLFAAGGHLSVDDVEQALRRRSLHIG
jgi:Fe2+ or Zn2+ uptake regulation protein